MPLRSGNQTEVARWITAHHPFGSRRSPWIIVHTVALAERPVSVAGVGTDVGETLFRFGKAPECRCAPPVLDRGEQEPKPRCIVSFLQFAERRLQE